MSVDKIEELEARIKQLLERHEKVKEDKLVAELQLREKESESHQLRGQIRQFELERSELRERVEKILGQFSHLDIQ